MQKMCIRLYTIGKYKYPVYNIVVSLSTKRISWFFDKIGTINPNKGENFFYLDTFKLAFWLNRGAKMNKSLVRWLAKFLVYEKVDDKLVGKKVKLKHNKFIKNVDK